MKLIMPEQSTSNRTDKVVMPVCNNYNKRYKLRDEHLSGLLIRNEIPHILHQMKLKIVGFCWKQSTKCSFLLHALTNY